MKGKLVKGLSLKASVDVEQNRVIFVESDEDFIDILLSFLTMPLGSIIRLIRYQPPAVGIGCMDNLYQSVENLDVQLFQTEACKSMLLHPRNGAAAQCESLKLTVDDSEPLQYFCCGSWDCISSRYKLLSHYRNAICGCGKRTNIEMYLSEKENEQELIDPRDGVFVKGLTRMIVSDELKILPPLTATSFSLLSKLGLTDGSTIEERTFNIGVDEVLSLLKLSLVSRIPLTETLLRKSSELNNGDYDQGCSTDIDQRSFAKSLMVETSSKVYKKICAKLFVSKSKKVVCYAEAGEDFVDLLFSFLTVPLSHVAKDMKGDTSRGCINHLYNSIQDIEAEHYLKSNDHKAMLVSPKLVQGFGLGNQLLGIEECKHQQRIYSYVDNGEKSNKAKLTSDETLLPSSSIYPVSLLRVMDPKSHCKDATSGGGFVKGPSMFTITDNLVITPISPVSGLSVLSKLKVPFSDIEEHKVHVGKAEASRLLVAAVVTKSALTNAFLV